MLFYPFALLIVVGAIGVVASRHIVHTAMFLLVTLIAVAALYLLLEAEFLAAIQLIVYVGGTLILIVFGVMLTSTSPKMTFHVPVPQKILGYLIGFCLTLLMMIIGLQLVSNEATDANLPEGTAAVIPDTVPVVETPHYGITELGEALLGKYVLPFELAGVLLLVVMIGAAYIAKGRTDQAEDAGEGSL